MVTSNRQLAVLLTGEDQLSGVMEDAAGAVEASAERMTDALNLAMDAMERVGNAARNVALGFAGLAAGSGLMIRSLIGASDAANEQAAAFTNLAREFQEFRREIGNALVTIIRPFADALALLFAILNRIPGLEFVIAFFLVMATVVGTVVGSVLLLAQTVAQVSIALFVLRVVVPFVNAQFAAMGASFTVADIAGRGLVFTLGNMVRVLTSLRFLLFTSGIGIALGAIGAVAGATVFNQEQGSAPRRGETTNNVNIDARGASFRSQEDLNRLARSINRGLPNVQ